jgi:hypothetical protein
LRDVSSEKISSGNVVRKFPSTSKVSRDTSPAKRLSGNDFKLFFLRLTTFKEDIPENNVAGRVSR